LTQRKTHYVADSLSRAAYWDPPEVDSVFCLAINPTQGIHDILRQAAAEEDYKRILEAISNGKSIKDCHPAAALRSEWDYLSVINGLVEHDCKRIVIPRGPRDATPQVLHKSHTGVVKTAEAAKQLYFWPKMNEHIKNMIDTCKRCQFYKASKQKQEQIQQTPFKDLYPMAEVGADLFEAGKHHFLIVVDRYSGFPLVARLNSMTAESIIGHMEKMFFLLGRPGEIKCDNGPCFRTEFKNWAKERDIVVYNSAPNKPMSNGLAERAVGIVKHMLLKHHLNHEAFMHALMEFRSTPRTDSYLPSQVFYVRRMKTDAPITDAALRMRTDLSAAESARQRVSDSKRNSANSQSKTRRDMISGQTVSVQNPTTKRWGKRGIIVEARNPRNRNIQVKVDGTIRICSEIFLCPVHIPLTDQSCALTGPQRSVCDPASFPPLAPRLPAPPRRSARVQERKARETAVGMVNAIFATPTPTREEEKKKPPPTTRKEGKKKIFGPPLTEGRKKEEEREGQQQPPTCSSGQVQAAAAQMGLPKMLTGQFVFFQQINNSHIFLMKQEKSTMLITVPSLIAAGIATAVVTGGITGTAVYLTAGDADVVTGDQIKTEGVCTSSSWDTWSHGP
jgi:transposase InsO family protein